LPVNVCVPACPVKPLLPPFHRDVFYFLEDVATGGSSWFEQFIWTRA